MLPLLAPPPVTTASLLGEMHDLGRLTRRPEIPYRTVEWSSYDRRSKEPGTPDWFANEDWGKYIRSETNEGRTEWVMAEHTGPGAVLRLWSANPMGTVRIYLDGEAKPRLTARLADLLTGKAPGLGEPFGYIASQGRNLYYPMPFARGMKITLAAETPEDALDRVYYTVHTRTYPESTAVETYNGPLNRLPSDESVPTVNVPAKMLRLPARGTVSFRVDGTEASMIRELKLESLDNFRKVPVQAPDSPESVFKHVEVRLIFDDVETGRLPLPDFFAAGVFPASLDTIAAKVVGAKTFIQRLPMPFRRSAVIQLVNRSPRALRFRASARVQRNAPADYVLHANWVADINPSRPFRDIEMLNATGEGRYVGSVLHVQNPSTAWWGEGDEKVWVDDDKFPSQFGTGTEDYFGYAWSDPAPFNRLYHAQPRADGPGNGGQISNVRWHILDDIPFRKRIKFDLEMWHWHDVPSRFDTTAFWYAPLSSGHKPTPIALETLKIIAGPQPPKPVPGAIEGETMHILRRTGGTTELQSYFHLSRGKQLWWRDAADGDRLDLALDVPRAGRYRLVANQAFAVDYGIHGLKVNGNSLGERDFFAPQLNWKVVSWGEVTLPKGRTVLSFTVRGTNPAAKPARRMLGLDYVKLEPLR